MDRVIFGLSLFVYLFIFFFLGFIVNLHTFISKGVKVKVKEGEVKGRKGK